jgi:GNAT superfamily N-acetyltransferase
MECGGAYAVFDGIDSPCTQSFGLGLFAELNEATLNAIEKFLLDHEAPVMHEVSPFAGVAALDLLCRRGYRPIEMSSVVYRSVAPPAPTHNGEVTLRIIGADEAELWSETSARGWAHDHPELKQFLLEFGMISTAREQTVSFVAEVDGKPGAAGVLCLHEGVAVFAGSATVPELRRRGLQSALLEARMNHAFEHGCDLAMMAAMPGSDSQRNAERKGFQIAYTRTKWQLFK